jgi:hypothetical protein
MSLQTEAKEFTLAVVGGQSTFSRGTPSFFIKTVAGTSSSDARRTGDFLALYNLGESEFTYKAIGIIERFLFEEGLVAYSSNPHGTTVVDTPRANGVRFDFGAVVSDMMIVLGQEPGLLDPEISRTSILSAVTLSRDGQCVYTTTPGYSVDGDKIILRVGSSLLSGIAGDGWSYIAGGQRELFELFYNATLHLAARTETARRESGAAGQAPLPIPKLEFKTPVVVVRGRFGFIDLVTEIATFNLGQTERDAAVVDLLKSSNASFKIAGRGVRTVVNTGKLDKGVVQIHISAERAPLVTMANVSMVGLLVSIHAQLRKGSDPVFINSQTGGDTNDNMPRVVMMLCHEIHASEQPHSWNKLATAISHFLVVQRYRGLENVPDGMMERVSSVDHATLDEDYRFLLSLTCFLRSWQELSSFLTYRTSSKTDRVAITRQLEASVALDRTRAAMELRISLEAQRALDRAISSPSTTPCKNLAMEIASALTAHKDATIASID